MGEDYSLNDCGMEFGGEVIQRALFFYPGCLQTRAIFAKEESKCENRKKESSRLEVPG